MDPSGYHFTVTKKTRGPRMESAKKLLKFMLRTIDAWLLATPPEKGQRFEMPTDLFRTENGQAQRLWYVEEKLEDEAYLQAEWRPHATRTI
jgi:hypothetical protein